MSNGSINKVILVGRLGKEPEIRATQNGQKIANLSVATSESWKDKNTGGTKTNTEWHKVVVFNEHLSNFIEKNAQKGSSVYIEGSLATRKYTGNDGVEKYTTEIVISRFKGEFAFVGGKGDGIGSQPQKEKEKNKKTDDIDDILDNTPF